MKRIDKVYEVLLNANKNQWFTAMDIAGYLDISRANASSDLNVLVRKGLAEKCTDKRPVTYKAALKEPAEKTTALETFTEQNPSLFTAIEQAKAAILYPPRGMNMLILGETGTGKSMLAGMIHSYAIEMKIMADCAPFITFNCADYAHNPQLLLSQLFGVKKGAYTGATEEKEGLIEKAHTGILFLDEVHRLPSEGQEMFFTFMDKKLFRRLGETQTERSADVLIIAATTENPESALLNTFTRRIPMVIKIPNLKERTLEERFYLINQFMREESARLNRPIKMSVNSMRAFISYDCLNNVGQLKTDIQLACAKAYADFLSNRQKEIIISSNDLHPYIREGLYKKIKHRQIWNQLIGINRRFYIFNIQENFPIIEDRKKQSNIYDYIEMQMTELKAQNISSQEISDMLFEKIEDYFNRFFYNPGHMKDLKTIENIVGNDIVTIASQIIDYAQEQLGRFFSKQTHYALIMHIDNTVKRIQSHKRIHNPNIKKIQKQYAREFETALDCLSIIEDYFDIQVPEDEAGFLSMFFIYDNKDDKNTTTHKNVQVIVIAHGTSTASSMAKTVNFLLGSDHIIGINAQLDKSPQEVLKELKETLSDIQNQSDILLLVDMGSLTSFGEELEKEMDITVKTVPLVSTLHVLEAGRKALIGEDIYEIYKDALAVNNFIDAQIQKDKDKKDQKNKLKIVTICATGEGTAKAVKDILHQKLELDLDLITIIPYQFQSPDMIQAKLKALENIIFIVSTFDVQHTGPVFTLDSLFSNQSIQQMQEIIDTEITYIKMETTLGNQLSNSNGKETVRDIKKIMTHLQQAMKVKFKTSVLIGIVFHLSCMLDRLLENTVDIRYDNIEILIRENALLYSIIKKELYYLENKYSVLISDDEIGYIINFFQKENFLEYSLF